MRGDEAVAQVTRRSCRCHLPGNIQGWIGWGFEQLGLLEGIPAHGKGLGS